MNLNTIVEVKRPASADEIAPWRDGYAWLAGGTWLFSEPQIATDTLIDLERSAGRRSSVRCRARDRRDLPHRRALSLRGARRNGRAAPLFRECCDAFLASFKIWNAATVGGNICMSLPAGADDLADRRRWRRSTRCGRATAPPREVAGGRLRHRQPRQRAAAGRAAAQHPPAGRGAAQALSPSASCR